MVGRAEVKPAWESNVKRYCGTAYSQQDYFLAATVKRMGVTVLGYGLYFGHLLSTRCFRGRQGIYSAPKEERCRNFFKYLGRLSIAVLMEAPFFALFLYTNWAVKKGHWLDFVLDALLIFAMASIPAFLLDIVCFKLGLYSREQTHGAPVKGARILDEPEADEAEQSLSDRGDEKLMDGSARDLADSHSGSSSGKQKHGNQIVDEHQLDGNDSSSSSAAARRRGRLNTKDHAL